MNGQLDRETPVIKRRRQAGGIVIWAGIYSDKLIGPYKVHDVVKLTSQSYYEFLDKIFFLDKSVTLVFEKQEGHIGMYIIL